MQYKSPIRFFEYSQIEVSDPDVLHLPRIKKQIAAEFNMEPSGIITLDGIDYSKQDILSFLDAPEGQTLLHFHVQIWEHKSLLQFLESGQTDAHFEQEVAALKQDIAFIGFCSPYFALQFNKEMKKRLQIHDVEAAADWVAYCEMILIADGEVAFSSTVSYLEEAVRLFRNLNKTTFLNRKEEVDVWTAPWARFVNRLPDNLYSLKDDLAMVLINFCVEIQGVDERTCFLISKQMIQLDFVDPTHTRLIRENHEIYAEKVAGTDLNPQGRRMVARQQRSRPNYLWIIVVLAMVVIRLMDKGCTDRNDHSVLPMNTIGMADDLVNMSFFSKARSIGSGHSRSGMKEDWETAVEGFPMYLSYLQSADTADQVTLELRNSTGDSLYLFLRDRGYSTVLIPIADREELRLTREALAPIDFVLHTADQMQLSLRDSVDCFLLQWKGATKDTALVRTFTNEAPVHLADTSYRHLLRLEIMRNGSAFYIRARDPVRLFRTRITP